MERMDVSTRLQRALDRRAFLKISGILGLSLASGGLVPTAAEAVKFDEKDYKISKTEQTMGTFVSITLLHPSKNQAEEAMQLAFAEIRRLAATLTRFDEGAAVAQLNKQGALKDMPLEVMEVVAEAMAYYRLTHGAFDMTVKPVLDLLKERLGQGKPLGPTEKELREELVLVDSSNVELENRTIAFKRSGMGITLDGIAKGYVVDKASDFLVARGVKKHLINAGGDIRARGGKEGSRPWVVAIEDPRKKNQYPDVIRLKDGAVATSGNYEVYYDREKMFHHIVNPSTGMSPVTSAGVSVSAETTVKADALSTSVFVMGPRRGVGFIDSLPKTECLIVARDGSLSKTRGWKNLEA